MLIHPNCYDTFSILNQLLEKKTVYIIAVLYYSMHNPGQAKIRVFVKEEQFSDDRARAVILSQGLGTLLYRNSPLYHPLWLTSMFAFM